MRRAHGRNKVAPIKVILESDKFRQALEQIAGFWPETEEGEELVRIAKKALTPSRRGR